MSSVTTELFPDDADYERSLKALQRPRPLASLTASAKRLTSREVKRVGNGGKAQPWQEDAWDMYDLVGEQRFLATTLSNRMSQARFFVGKMPRKTTDEIEEVEEGPAYDAFETINGRGQRFNQMIARGGLNLFMPGDGYFLGIPRNGSGEPTADREEELKDGIPPVATSDFDGIDIKDLEWKMYSVSECKINTQNGEITVKQSDQKSVKYDPDRVVLIRFWRSHPRYWWQADSPTRSSLPVLRELVGLTMHISAQIDSRLAGAGVFLIPASADEAIRAQMGSKTEGGEDQTDDSPLGDSIMEAMITPIGDRSSASALVPIMPVVPDDSIEKFRFISFATPLDGEARELRDEAIRRLALGQDCPPELLLGVASMNHWGAWLVREDVVTTHLEPPLALICDAFTTEFLWPVLELQGVEDFEDYVIWYDVDHLIVRPNRAQDAAAGHAAGVVSDESYRDALGFDDTDAPPADPNDPVTKLILDMVRTAPTLMQNPGLNVIAEQIRALVENQPVPGAPEIEGGEAGAETGEEEQPSNEGPPAEEGAPSVVASAVVQHDHDVYSDCPDSCPAHGEHLKLGEGL